LKTTKTIIILLLIMICTAGCANLDKSNGRKVENQKSFFGLSPSAEDIVSEALAYLNNQEGMPDYNAARTKLEFLLQEHPQSKWAGNARGLIRTIDKLLVLQTKVQSDKNALQKISAEKTKLFRENETLKKDNKHLAEKLQTETVRLQQENEQLKNDIALLKKLEIQLEKREKMLK
jgi:hypothetical protein